MVEVFWRFKGNKIGGIFRNLWRGEWTRCGKYPSFEKAEDAVRQWKNLHYFRHSFDFSVGFIPVK